MECLRALGRDEGEGLCRIGVMAIVAGVRFSVFHHHNLNDGQLELHA